MRSDSYAMITNHVTLHIIKQFRGTAMALEYLGEPPEYARNDIKVLLRRAADELERRIEHDEAKVRSPCGSSGATAWTRWPRSCMTTEIQETQQHSAAGFDSINHHD